MRVLVVNAGSSSLKLALLDDQDATLAEAELPTAEGPIDGRRLHQELGSTLGEADAVGHRIVHGGDRFCEPVRVDASVRAALRELVDLAPLHQPKSLAALDAVSKLLPELPAVACFDTAFHATLPAFASTYALPAPWRERWGLRRYGFHGLSHAWVARRVPALLGRDISELRVVSCHLGAGASLCAISEGRSLDTTMGFTPLEGLVMATRSGSVDPGLLLWLLEHEDLSASELAETLERRSGLFGLCGSADMREVLERAQWQERPPDTSTGSQESGPAAAQLALGVYLHRLRGSIAAMACALGGIDVLAFTGGVGEHSAELRERTACGLAFLGVALDQDRNRSARPDAEIGTLQAPVSTMVLRAREDLEIAGQVRAVLEPQAPALE